MLLDSCGVGTIHWPCYNGVTEIIIRFWSRLRALFLVGRVVGISGGGVSGIWIIGFRTSRWTTTTATI